MGLCQNKYDSLICYTVKWNHRQFLHPLYLIRTSLPNPYSQSQIPHIHFERVHHKCISLFSHREERERVTIRNKGHQADRFARLGYVRGLQKFLYEHSVQYSLPLIKHCPRVNFDKTRVFILIAWTTWIPLIPINGLQVLKISKGGSKKPSCIIYCLFPLDSLNSHP